MRERLPLFGGMALLAIALLLGSAIIGQGIRDRGKNNVIVVTGSAKKRISSDYITWTFSVASQQVTAPAAAQELESWTTAIHAFLTKHGVKDAELSSQPVLTETLTTKGRVSGYRLSRSFAVNSARVQAISAVADQSSQLLAQGIPLEAGSPQYVYTKLSDLRPQLLAAATKDAQRRARVIVEATGGKLGGLRGVDVGVFQVTSPNSTQVEDYGVYDTSTISKDVTAVVNITFAVGG
jgi:hypothetical protein